VVVGERNDSIFATWTTRLPCCSTTHKEKTKVSWDVMIEVSQKVGESLFVCFG
jgi:exopolysaccharide biosynthesis predicted pyruvyltransferase EpsI